MQEPPLPQPGSLYPRAPCSFTALQVAPATKLGLRKGLNNVRLEHDF